MSDDLFDMFDRNRDRKHRSGHDHDHEYDHKHENEHENHGSVLDVIITIQTTNMTIKDTTITMMNTETMETDRHIMKRNTVLTVDMDRTDIMNTEILTRLY